MADVDYIRIISVRKGLGMKLLSKEERISNLLNRMAGWNISMALKGGTAMNRGHLGKMARFSEDIDIDVFGLMSAEEKIKKLDGLMLSLDGFTVGRPRMTHLTARYDASYVNDFGEKDKVMLDFYLANAVPHSARPIDKETLRSCFIESVDVEFPTYSLEDLIAQKLIALGGRFEGKDVYDLHFALDLDFDATKTLDALGKRLVLRKSENAPMSYLRQLESQQKYFTDRATVMMNETNHYIPIHLRPDWRAFIMTTFDKIKMVF